MSFQICPKTEGAQASGMITAVSLFMFPADMITEVAMVDQRPCSREGLVVASLTKLKSRVTGNFAPKLCRNDQES